MNWPLFFSTFLMIFLAELGDKTQLAVMTQSASSSGKWTIFLAGALALVSTTALGVLAGDLIRRFVPDERWIKGAAGAVFLGFGVWMLMGVFFQRPQSVISALPAAEAWSGRFVLQQTERLERGLMDLFTRLADSSLKPDEKTALLRMAEESKWHHEAMLCALASGSDRDIPFTETMIRRFPPMEKLMGMAVETLDDAVLRERAMARYYQVLSETVPVARLGETFKALAVAEENLASRLERLKEAK